MGASAPFLSMTLFGLENLDIKISAYEVDRRVSQEELWTYYLGHCHIGKRIKIPWDKDNNPSASLFRSSSTNDILLQDHRSNQTFNIYHFLIKMGKVDSFKEGLHLINEDFNLGLGKLNTSQTSFRKERPMVETATPKATFRKVIKIIEKNFTAEGYKYWQQFGIKPSTLKFFNVHQITGYHIQHAPHEDFYTHTFPTELAFAYEFFDPDVYERTGKLELLGYKIYRPGQEGERKWISNVGKNVIQGHLQLKKYIEMFDIVRLKDKSLTNYKILDGLYKTNLMWKNMNENFHKTFKTCILTKSLKDIMVWYEMGIISFAPQNETPIFPSPSLLYDLSLWFDDIVVNYDNDITGIRNARKLIQDNQHRLHGKILLTTPHKDISDYVKEFGIHNATIKYKNFLQNLSEFEERRYV